MLTRKEFLNTLGAATVSAVISKTAGAEPTDPARRQAPRQEPGAGSASGSGRVKRSVTFYCYQDEYKLGEMNLEDCIAAVADLGADGIEILGEESVPDFPSPSDQFIEHWHSLMTKYNTKPVCYDAFLEMKLRSNQPMTMDESVDMVVRDLKLAKSLGFKSVRALRATPPEVMERALPYLEKYDMNLAVEIHSSASIKGGFADRYIDLFQRTNSERLGLVPDMSLFTKKIPRIQQAWFLRNGAQPSVVEYVSKAYEDNVPAAKALEQVMKMSPNKMDLKWANDAYNHGPITNEPKDILLLMPYAIHVHAKFYEVTEDYKDLNIPYDEIMPLLLQSGYTGYISSEYEGQRYVDDAFHPESVEQVRRQQVMLRRLLGEV
jgi:sugar phosphate isomerase/epimerase